MDQIADTRAEWSEEKKRKIATGEREHTKVLENIKEVLARRNAMSGQPVPPQVLDMQIQGMVCISDLSALVDCLETMGKIDRVEYMAKCNARIARMFQIIERPN